MGTVHTLIRDGRLIQNSWNLGRTSREEKTLSRLFDSRNSQASVLPGGPEGPRYISTRRQSWSDSHINRVTGALSRIKVELSGRNWYTILLLYVLCLTFFTAMSSPIIILSMDPHSPRVVAFPPGQTHQDINRPSGQLFPRTLHVWRSIADEPKLKNAN